MENIQWIMKYIFSGTVLLIKINKINKMRLHARHWRNGKGIHVSVYMKA